MIDAKSLLDRFLGAGTGDRAASTLGQADRKMSGMGIPGGLAGGAAAAGVIGLLLGGKKARKLAGSAVGYGGAAALGALASRAWQNYQSGQAAPASLPAPSRAEIEATDARFLPTQPAADGKPFGIALVRAMVAAAKADGHMDGTEQASIFQAVERAGLDAEAKAALFDAMNAPSDPATIAALAATPEQAAELWLSARLSIEPDQPAERAFLDALGHRLGLEPALRSSLEREASAALASA
ncbi:tellurite resistance TerB family protein [Elioraea sp.]|uniref:tellurite resistance TerB family protein n=1 Tax=Elioraea sp. TaxID=2185103 RepID=UPI0025B91566|nr:tellurite resistance TerB family protein [Elioraea sp.]